jgi:Asp-tRNA(Asn)/Glu-tRNA(Gln) amidotransferase A subunit family amidase
MTTIDADVAAALERLEAIDPDVRAFVEEPSRRRRLEASPPGEGPVHAVPVGVKDLFRVDGLPTSVGSQLPPSIFDGEESLVVTKLKQAGAVVLGKTTMDEFAYCEPPPTRNPLDLRRTPGGSSSGSAAAVAAGICRLAIGSQTLQSVVVPAAFCGVVGFKLTFGRLAFDGIPLSPSIDTVGFLAPSVAEIRSAVAALLPDWRDPPSPPRPVLGVPEPWGPRARSTEGWRGLRRHLRVLRRHGFEFLSVDVPWGSPQALSDWDGRAVDLLHAEMALAHAPWFDRFVHLYRPRTADGVRQGRAIPSERVGECRGGQASLAELLMESASRSGIDGWICPSAAGVAPIGYEEAGGLSMTALWSYAGFPAISLPVLDGTDGMPLGVQLIAPPGHDEALLEWAELVEAALAEHQPAGPGTTPA